MNIMDSDVFYKKYIEKDLEEYYVPHLFEDVCRQYLIRKNRAGKVEPEKATELKENVQLIELEEVFSE